MAMFEQCTYVYFRIEFYNAFRISCVFLPILRIQNSVFKTDCMSWLGSKIKVQMRK